MAGTVTVQNNGSITTQGANAEGILAQSIGGSGGAGGSASGFVAVGGNAKTNPLPADGGAVNIGTNSGSITTNGISAIGILGQSIGGGGGDGGSASGAVVSLGGSGGAGGAGGVVSSTNNYNTIITTNGDFSPPLPCSRSAAAEAMAATPAARGRLRAAAAAAAAAVAAMADRPA